MAGVENGQNRDLLFVLQSYMKYPTDANTHVSGRLHIADNRIDGRNPRDGSDWNYAFAETTDAPSCNIYLQGDFRQAGYTRTHPCQLDSIPHEYKFGPPPGWARIRIFPGMLFMFGQMEDNTANPFRAGGGGGSGSGLSGATGVSGKVVVQ